MFWFKKRPPPFLPFLRPKPFLKKPFFPKIKRKRGVGKHEEVKKERNWEICANTSPGKLKENSFLPNLPGMAFLKGKFPFLKFRAPNKKFRP